MKKLIRIVKYHILLLVPLLFSLVLYFAWHRLGLLSPIINLFVYSPYLLLISYLIVNELSKWLFLSSTAIGALSIYASWLIQRYNIQNNSYLSFEFALILGYAMIGALLIVILGNIVILFSSLKKKNTKPW